MGLIFAASLGPTLVKFVFNKFFFENFFPKNFFFLNFKKNFLSKENSIFSDKNFFPKQFFQTIFFNFFQNRILFQIKSFFQEIVFTQKVLL